MIYYRLAHKYNRYIKRRFIIEQKAISLYKLRKERVSFKSTQHYEQLKQVERKKRKSCKLYKSLSMIVVISKTQQIGVILHFILFRLKTLFVSHFIFSKQTLNYVAR